jgi:hypothetical protein
MSNWAKGLVNGKPTTASAQREVLARALADAEQNSNAARAAQTEFQANAEAAAGALGRLDGQIAVAAKLASLEEAAKRLPEIAAAIATAFELRQQLDAARAEIATGLVWGSTEFSEVGAALHSFDNARGLAEATPITSTEPFVTGWRKFAAAVAKDSKVSFEDAQKTIAHPTPFSPTLIDPATAAMREALSYPSQSLHAAHPSRIGA